jgi:two-component system LytT family response regulator
MTERRPRVLLAEDEDFARERITRLISERPDFELAAVCRNGAEALAAIGTEAIDIALLDIEMPGISGLDLLRRIGATDAPMPLVVFITAHPRFAVDAFAGEAVDYVLKPFEGERLDKALRIARERLWSREAIRVNQRIRSVIDASAAGGVTDPDADNAIVPGRLVVRDRGRLLILHDTQIDWAQADGRYCVLNCG